ncbi:MAG TPA: PAS domain-containing sensor histidine kinase, partial [Verrucomicrobiae bacterium]|nr:PAS domain-containing sensor histidine kinase [Verrucomicrobiae bacterium]
MTETERPPRSVSETRKRKREWTIIALASVLIVFFTGVEIHLSRLSADVTRGNNILIFALINVIVLLIILLVFLVSRNVVKLFLERRSNAPGAKLRTRLVLAFLGLSLVPTMLLFFVSAGFIHNTVQNWFNKQVEDALTESLEVAQTYYKSSGENALYYAQQISGIIKEQKLLNDDNLPLLRDLIRQKQKEYNLGVVEVFSAQNEELVRASNPNVPRGEFTNPSSADIRMALAGKKVTQVNPMGKADLIRGIVPVHSNWNDRDVVGVVVVNYYVPHSLVAKMNEISASYKQFRQLKILKNPITTGYILTLFLMTMAIVLLSVWFG